MLGNKFLCIIGAFSIFASVLVPGIFETALLMLLGVLSISVGIIGCIIDATNRIIYKLTEEIREKEDTQIFMLQDILISLESIQAKLEKQ